VSIATNSQDTLHGIAEKKIGLQANSEGW